MAYPKTPSPAGSPATACPTICEPNKDPCTPPKATSSTTTRSSAIEELGKRYDICEIAYDRWGVVQMSQNLEGLGFTVVPFGQGFEDMSPPSKELMKLALEHRLAHGGHPVLAWMADNVTIRQDPAGNIKLDKQNSTEKIDGIVALVMALDRAIPRIGLRHPWATRLASYKRGRSVRIASTTIPASTVRRRYRNSEDSASCTI